MRTLAFVVGGIIILAAMKAAAGLIVPLLLAVTIAVAFQPVAERLSAHGLPPIVASVITMLCVIGLLAGIGWLLALAAGDLVEASPRYAAELSVARDEAIAWLEEHNLETLSKSVRDLDLGAIAGGLVARLVFMTSNLLGNLMVVLFLTSFIQLEAALMKQKLEILFHREKRPMDRTLQGIAEVQRYLRVKLALSMANGVLLGSWCWIWGVSNPLLWGVIAFALNFVPVIGSLIAAVPPVLLGLVELGWGGAIGIVAGYIMVNLVVDNILEPRLMGRTLGLSPLVLMVSLLLWGFVLGPVGALLSVPLTVAVRVYCDSHPETRWIGLLLASGTRGYRDLAKPKPA